LLEEQEIAILIALNIIGIADARTARDGTILMQWYHKREGLDDRPTTDQPVYIPSTKHWYDFRVAPENTPKVLVSLRFTEPDIMCPRYFGRKDEFTDENGVFDAVKADRDVLGKANSTLNGRLLLYCSIPELLPSICVRMFEVATVRRLRLLHDMKLLTPPWKLPHQLPMPSSTQHPTISPFRCISSLFQSSKLNMVTRRPSHAGSWYTDNGKQLSQQLDGWLEAVPSSTTPIGSTSSQQGDVSIPTPNARAIIAP
jgi:hypothetical protein